METLLANWLDAFTSVLYDPGSKAELRPNPICERTTDYVYLYCIVSCKSFILPVRSWKRKNSMKATQIAIFCLLSSDCLFLIKLFVFKLAENLFVDIDMLLEDWEYRVAFESAYKRLLVDFGYRLVIFNSINNSLKLKQIELWEGSTQQTWYVHVILLYAAPDISSLLSFDNEIDIFICDKLPPFVIVFIVFFVISRRIHDETWIHDFINIL